MIEKLTSLHILNQANKSYINYLLYSINIRIEVNSHKFSLTP